MTSGHAAERELSNELEDEYHMAAMPSGGSGGGTDRARPDVWAARRAGRERPAVQVVIEVKRRASSYPPYVHFDASEVHALRSFASRAGARPWIVIRPHRQRSPQRWHLFGLDELKQTADGNYSLVDASYPGAPLSAITGDGNES